MDGIEIDVELRVNGLASEAEMLQEENHCTLSILWMEYMFGDLHRCLFLELAVVACDVDAAMEKVKEVENCVEVSGNWDSKTSVQQL